MNSEDVFVGMWVRVVDDEPLGYVGQVTKGGYLPWILVRFDHGRLTLHVDGVEPATAIDRLGKVAQ